MEILHKYFGGDVIPEKILLAHLDPERLNRSYNNTNRDMPLSAGNVSCLVVSAGWMEITVDKKVVRCEREFNNVVHVSPFNVIYRCRASNDISGFILNFTKKFMDENFSGKRPFHPEDMQEFQINPAITLDQYSINRLTAVQRAIKEKFDDRQNKFRDELVTLKTLEFVFEFGSIMAQEEKMPSETVSTRSDTVLKQLFYLLMENCRRHHEVTFYAEKLCITPQYLNKLTRTKMGRTVSSLIADILVTEAILLLQDEELNIQEISDKLHFSDQSAFGKFFKKQTGRSPAIYRRGL